jgi:hypothetical protein
VSTIVLAVYHLHVIFFPYPLECREGASIQTTNALLQGINPFAIENQPQYTNIYGVLYSAFAYPFAVIFGSSLQVHRAVSGIFILLSCLLVYLFARSNDHPILPSIVTAVVLYASLLYLVTPLVRPDSVGLFFFLLSLYLPYRHNYSRSSLLAAGVIGIFAVLAKTFFLLTYPFLASYLFFFVSKRKGIAYSVFSCIILGLVAVAVAAVYETYIATTLFYNMSGATYSVGRVSSQLYFAVRSYAFILVVGVLAVGSIVILRRGQIRAFIMDFAFRQGSSKVIDVRSIGRPLFTGNVACTWYYLLCGIVIFCASLGRHSGAWMTYFYQLISPFGVLVLLDVVAYSTIRHGYLAFMLAGIVNLWGFYAAALPHYTVRQVQSQWRQIYQLVENNRAIFNSPAIAQVLQAQNREVYDSGLSECFTRSWLPKRLAFLSGYYSLDSKILKRLEEFRRSVAQAVEHKEYDVIAISPEYSPFMDESLLSGRYEWTNTLLAPMPHTGQEWPVQVWTRK